MNHSTPNEQSITRAPSKPRFTREQVATRRRQVKAAIGAVAATGALIGVAVLAENANSGPNSAQRAAAIKTIDGMDNGGKLELPAGVNIRMTPVTENVDDQGGGPSNILRPTKGAIEVDQPLTSSKYPGWDAFILPGDHTAEAATVGWVNVDALEGQTVDGQVMASYKSEKLPYGPNAVAHVNHDGTISVANNANALPAVDPNAGLSRHVSH